MLGMASQLAEREDSILCSDVRDKLFGPNEFSRRDLAALNVMRGRDNGIADYNTVNENYILGLSSLTVSYTRGVNYIRKSERMYSRAQFMADEKQKPVNS